jgi:circadian clock protein KaiB
MDSKSSTFILRLYMAGETERSRKAVADLKALCRDKLAGHYTIEVVDVRQDPALAKADHHMPTPALLKKLPRPLQQWLLELASLDNVLLGVNVYSG